MHVWIDQDLCTGDGLCEEIAPEVFFAQDDGLYYVKESAKNFGTEKKFDGDTNPAGPDGQARIPPHRGRVARNPHPRSVSPTGAGRFSRSVQVTGRRRS